MMSQVRRAAFQTAHKHRKISVNSVFSTLLTCWWNQTVCVGLERSPVSLQVNIRLACPFSPVLLPAGSLRSSRHSGDFISCSSLIGHRRLLILHWLTAEAAVHRGVWLDRKYEQVSVASVWVHSCCLKWQNFIDTTEALQQPKYWTNNLFNANKS